MIIESLIIHIKINFTNKRLNKTIRSLIDNFDSLIKLFDKFVSIKILKISNSTSIRL